MVSKETLSRLNEKNPHNSYHTLPRLGEGCWVYKFNFSVDKRETNG